MKLHFRDIDLILGNKDLTLMIKYVQFVKDSKEKIEDLKPRIALSGKNLALVKK